MGRVKPLGTLCMAKVKKTKENIYNETLNSSFSFINLTILR